MPRRNTTRVDASENYYHVYARGNSRHRIYLDEQDYLTFLNLFARYLSPEEAKDPYGISYPNFYNKVDLLAYCLMPNHFHLLVYQRHAKMLTSLMQSIMTSYSRYFNKKYGRSGSLFESRFRATMISDDTYLMHITRYIHLNPRQWRDYAYSSLPYYLQRAQETWLRQERILELFPGSQEYLDFMADYEENKKMIDILKKELANGW
ncbi:transposase [Candidatus Saccharibacteria bacterium]|nr:MAG: transposase [Candidatus Saccharibacteria bacterium]